jgi:hypothetical protein
MDSAKKSQKQTSLNDVKRLDSCLKVMEKLLNVLQNVQVDPNQGVLRGSPLRDNPHLLDLILTTTQHLDDWIITKVDNDNWSAEYTPLRTPFYEKKIKGARPTDLLYYLMTHDYLESVQKRVTIIRNEEPNIGASLSLQFD